MRQKMIAFASVVLVVGLAPRAHAQVPPPPEVFSALDPSPTGFRITPYLQHQLDLAWRQDELRRTRFARVRTEGDLQALRAEIRGKLLEIIGGLPSERTPLNAQVVGTVPGSGYRIEKVVFESLPGVHVTALLYVPDGPLTRRPAVLVACGHAPDGKAFRNYQEIAGQLARRGYVVLCWDPVGQGERSQFWDAARGRSRYNLVCGEHAVLGNMACLAGRTVNRYMVWDGMRALDYLLTRPEVDGSRISVTGTSGGGFQSLYLGALDERIGVVAPSCFVTALPMRMANRIAEDPDSDPEQDPFGLVSAGIDHPGLLLLIYPRPLIVAAAIKDFFPIEGTRKTFREVRDLYARFGKGDHIALAQGNHTHMYSPENRQAAFAFLDHFNGLPAHPALDTVPILEPDALRCTPSGQVRVDLPGRGLPEVIRDDFRARRARGNSGVATPHAWASDADIQSLPVVPLGGTPATGAISWTAAGGDTLGDARIDRYRLYHGDGLVIPLLHIHRVGPREQSRVLLDLGLQGKAGPAEWAEVLSLLAEGYDVLSFDARGVGEAGMSYRAESGDDKTLAPADVTAAYFSPVSGVLANHVYNSLLTGRPYFSEIVEDAQIVSRFARARLGAARLSVRPRGEAGAWAEAVSRAVPDSELVAGQAAPFHWADVIEELREVWPIQYLVPGGALTDAPAAREP